MKTINEGKKKGQENGGKSLLDFFFPFVSLSGRKDAIGKKSDQDLFLTLYRLNNSIFSH